MSGSVGKVPIEAEDVLKTLGLKAGEPLPPRPKDFPSNFLSSKKKPRAWGIRTEGFNTAGALSNLSWTNPIEDAFSATPMKRR